MNRAGGLLLPDYHTHSVRCGHADGDLGEYVRAAIRKGLPSIGLSDHLPQLFDLDPELAMAPEELDAYVAEVIELKRQYPGFVLLGVEADYRPDTIDAVRALVSRYPFDYVLGSVHHIDGWGFDDPRLMHEWDRRDVDEVYRRYFQLVGDSAEAGVFTILGHVDLVKKFGHRPEDPAFDVVVGWRTGSRARGPSSRSTPPVSRRAVGEIYPHVPHPPRAPAHGVPVTFGSDAHTPEEVGSDFDRGAALALAAGFVEYAALVLGRRARPRTHPHAADTSALGPAGGNARRWRGRLRVGLICNPAAGGGRGAQVGSAVTEGLRRRGFLVRHVTTEGPGQATTAAEDMARSSDVVVAVGGDGTVNEVVNGLAGGQVPLGVVPAGTINVLAMELGSRSASMRHAA